MFLLKISWVKNVPGGGPFRPEGGPRISIASARIRAHPRGPRTPRGKLNSAPRTRIWRGLDYWKFSKINVFLRVENACFFSKRCYASYTVSDRIFWISASVFRVKRFLLLFVLDLLMNFFAFYSDSYSIIKNKQRSHQILFVWSKSDIHPRASAPRILNFGPRDSAVRASARIRVRGPRGH